MNFRANCISRGSSVPFDFPKIPGFPEKPPLALIRFAWLPPVALFGGRKFARFKALKTSHRNWKVAFSPTLKFLNTDWSVLHWPGPSNVFRPRLPSHARHGTANNGFEPLLQVDPPPVPMAHPKAAPGTLNQPLAHCWRLMSKLLPFGASGRSFRTPSLLKSQAPPTPQKGLKWTPDWKVQMPLYCHPPRMCPRKPF